MEGQSDEDGGTGVGDKTEWVVLPVVLQNIPGDVSGGDEGYSGCEWIGDGACDGGAGEGVAQTTCLRLA